MRTLFTLLLITGIMASYAAAQGQWERKADPPGVNGDFGSSFGMNGSGYVGFGTTDFLQYGSAKVNFWRYDPQTDSWEEIAPFPDKGRFSATVFSIGGFGYAGLGRYPNFGPRPDYPEAFWRYDPESDQWDRLGDFPGAWRFSAAGFVISNKFYLVSGNNFRSLLRDVWQYDPQGDSWMEMNEFPGKGRTKAISFSIDGKGYVGTGSHRDDEGNRTLLNDLWEYDPELDEWERKQDMPGPGREYAIAFSIDGRGYAGFGISGTRLSDFWEYNPDTDSWRELEGINGSRLERGTAFALDGKGYVKTGFDFEFWQFTPGMAVSNETGQAELPDKAALHPAWPNPFNPSTVIRYELPAGGEVSLSVYDVVGRRVAVLAEGHRAAGEHSVRFDGSTLSSGLYLVRLEAAGGVFTQKITLIK